MVGPTGLDRPTCPPAWAAPMVKKTQDNKTQDAREEGMNTNIERPTSNIEQ
jgi:hypothetical protein